VGFILLFYVKGKQLIIKLKHFLKVDTREGSSITCSVSFSDINKDLDLRLGRQQQVIWENGNRSNTKLCIVGGIKSKGQAHSGFGFVCRFKSISLKK